MLGVKRMSRWVLLLLSLLLVPVACQGERDQTSPQRPVIAVSMAPHKFLVKRIGGDLVDVIVVLPPGQSHGTYDPTPKQLIELSRAQAFFAVGVEIERAIIRRLQESNPSLRVVDLQAGINLMPMEAGHAHSDEEEPSEAQNQAEAHEHSDHQEGFPDPHTWLDPTLFALQGWNVANALSELDPAHAELFRQNAKALEAELNALDADLAKELAPFRGSPLFVYHSAYAYFAKRYGLKQVAIEAGGQEPGAEYLARITRLAQEAGAKVILVQPQYSKVQAENVAQSVHAAVVPVDHMSEDYVNNLRALADTIRDYSTKP